MDNNIIDKTLNEASLNILLQNIYDKILYYQVLLTTTLDSEYIRIISSILQDANINYNMLADYYIKTLGKNPPILTTNTPHIDTFTSGIAHGIINTSNDYKNYRDIYAVYNNDPTLSNIIYKLLTDSNIHGTLLNYIFAASENRNHDNTHQILTDNKN